MRFTVRHTFEVSVDDFWTNLFFDPEYNRRLYQDALLFRAYDVLDEMRHPDGAHDRRIRLGQGADLPPLVSRVVGSNLSVIEAGHFDARRQRWSYRVIPSALSEKLCIEGEVWCEPRGSSALERFAEVSVTVKLLGVGSKVEAFIERTLRESYDRAAAFTRHHLLLLGGHSASTHGKAASLELA